MCYEITVIEKSWQSILHKNPENHPIRAKSNTLRGLKGHEELPPFDKFLTEVLIFRSNRSLMFFKISVLKNFATFTGKHLCWPLQAFFYRTPTVAASGFWRQQIFWLNLVFIADSRRTPFALNSFINRS